MQLDLLQKELRAAQESLAAFADTKSGDEKSPDAFKTISEVSALLNVPQHVLRFWESKFPRIKPLKMRGGRRYYRPQDIEILTTIKTLLYKQGYTIKGAKKAIGQLVRGEMVIEEEKPTPAIRERQQNQVSVIRQELIAMRDALKPYVA